MKRKKRLRQAERLLEDYQILVDSLLLECIRLSVKNARLRSGADDQS